MIKYRRHSETKNKVFLFKNLDVNSRDFVIKAKSMDRAAVKLADCLSSRSHPLMIRFNSSKWKWSRVTARVIEHTYKFFNNNSGLQYFVVYNIPDDEKVTVI